MPIDPSALHARGLISDAAMERLQPVSMLRNQPPMGPEGPGGGGAEAGGGIGLPAQGEQTVIPPSSPSVQAAINRLRAWLPQNEVNGPNPVIRKNIAIMERGGPMSEAMAKHTLKTWGPHPAENGPMIDGPVIEGIINK